MDDLIARARHRSDVEVVAEVARLAAGAANVKPTAGQFRVARRGRTVTFTFDAGLCASGAGQTSLERKAVAVALGRLRGD
jgi:hypothetical protein